MAIVQCVPNFSEGIDQDKINHILDVARPIEGVKVVSVEADASYHRTVVTLLGEPEAVLEAVIRMAAETTKRIDMTTHKGEHSRMGAIDVIPFIPIQGVTMDDCIALARRAGKALWENYRVPVFLYEEAATSEGRRNLAAIRKGEFEAMEEKLKLPEWTPDFGDRVHPTAGVTAVGARLPLVAYNVDLNTKKVEVADAIAKAIRHSSGGFRYIKAGGVYSEEKGHVQVTMNITNYQKTPVYRVFETIKMEAKRYGVEVLGSEVVGLVPMEALVDSAAYYLGLYDFSMDKVLESHLINGRDDDER